MYSKFNVPQLCNRQSARQCNTINIVINKTETLLFELEQVESHAAQLKQEYKENIVHELMESVYILLHF